ncbi:MAG: MBL fold metallo-hydrolase, partial [Chitinivibrionia bacterium]|nr:MBL fold metallo-hydrolase [Chitinivibrionia bacterium]
AHIDTLVARLPENIKIIAGHGPLSTLYGLKRHAAMMRATSNIVREKMKAGKSLEEIKKEGLPEEWDSWSWRFIPTERWIELVYKSYSE